MTGLLAVRPRNFDSNPGSGTKFVPIQNVQTGCGVQPASFSEDTGQSGWGVKMIRDSV